MLPPARAPLSRAARAGVVLVRLGVRLPPVRVVLLSLRRGRARVRAEPWAVKSLSADLNINVLNNSYNRMYLSAR